MEDPNPAMCRLVGDFGTVEREATKGSIGVMNPVETLHNSSASSDTEDVADSMWRLSLLRGDCLGFKVVGLWYVGVSG